MSHARANAPAAIKLRICAAPKVRQIYWCDFPQDRQLPEFGKRRPVLILSYGHVLRGHCTVLPLSTADQSGMSAKWAHRLEYELGKSATSWVVCNHICTVANSRLSQFGKPIPRIDVGEFQQVLARTLAWLPRLEAQIP